MGHFDTVGIGDYAHLQDIAYNPEKLSAAYLNEDIPERVKLKSL